MKETDSASFRLVLAGFVLALIGLLSLLTLKGNEEIFLIVNQRITPHFGQAARLFSLLGESWAMGAMLLISFRMPFRSTLLLGVTWFVGALHSWLFKLWLCKGMARPFEAFRQLGLEKQLHLVDGVKIHHWNTFPSGHTITAVSLALIIPVLFPSVNVRLAFLSLLLALLCGFSRVILVQHWPQDVLGGMVLGITTALLSVKLVSIPGRKNWLETSLFSRIFPGKAENPQV